MKNIPTPSQETLNEWHENPNNWIFGVFYFNKKDNRVTISKRNEQMGITLNFGNPLSYLFLIIAFCFFGFIVFMCDKNKPS